MISSQVEDHKERYPFKLIKKLLITKGKIVNNVHER